MTEEVYRQPLKNFQADIVPAPVYTVPLLERGMAALEEINAELGLGFDDWDKDYYLRMFTEDLRRDPTSVELFDMAQSNSEHRWEVHQPKAVAVGSRLRHTRSATPLLASSTPIRS